MRNAYMTDELEAIYEQTVDFVTNEVVPHGEVWEEAGKVPREVLRQMGELGMFGLRVPEEHGGAGLGWVDLLVVLEETGRSLFPSPLVATTLAAEAIRRCGSEAQQTAYLPRLADGNEILARLATDHQPVQIPAAPELTVQEEVIVKDRFALSRNLVQFQSKINIGIVIRCAPLF